VPWTEIAALAAADDGFGPVDIYRDSMPWGVDIKGDRVVLNLLQQHFVVSGLSKQGKTAAAQRWCCG
jgi:DNA segregation ATPase FtsK/SpoIIIE, S-DNA-T family